MNGNEIINQADLDKLAVIKYPDPRLGKDCFNIEQIDDNLRILVEKMTAIMFETQGVGLAAPQVGLNIKLFVTSPNFNKEDVHIYLNPRIIEQDGWQEDEEGCLSLPGVNCKVKRRKSISIEAMDIDGNVINEKLEDFPARVFQHEFDHIEGKTLINRMSAVGKIANRKAIKLLQQQFTQ